MRTTINKKYYLSTGNIECPIELTTAIIKDGYKAGIDEGTEVSNNTPVIVKFSLKNIDDYYKVDKLTFNMVYFYGKQGFKLTVVDGDFSYEDAVSSILNSSCFVKNNRSLFF